MAKGHLVAMKRRFISLLKIEESLFPNRACASMSAVEHLVVDYLSSEIREGFDLTCDLGESRSVVPRNPCDVPRQKWILRQRQTQVFPTWPESLLIRLTHKEGARPEPPRCL
jgi:hypothetical protein